MKKPTEKEIMSIDNRDEYQIRGKKWLRDVKQNIEFIKKRKEKGKQFREWHKKNTNYSMVEYWEFVKNTKTPLKSQLNKTKHFWD